MDWNASSEQLAMRPEQTYYHVLLPRPSDLTMILFLKCTTATISPLSPISFTLANDSNVSCIDQRNERTDIKSIAATDRFVQQRLKVHNTERIIIPDDMGEAECSCDVLIPTGLLFRVIR